MNKKQYKKIIECLTNELDTVQDALRETDLFYSVSIKRLKVEMAKNLELKEELKQAKSTIAELLDQKRIEEPLPMGAMCGNCKSYDAESNIAGHCPSSTVAGTAIFVYKDSVCQNWQGKYKPPKNGE